MHSFRPTRVLDAGCGTGRVAIELARRGVEVVGIDRTAPMLARARRKAPHLDWRLGDLAEIELDAEAGTFDAVVMAGNVMIFVSPGTEAAVVANLATALTPDGILIAGFQTDRHLALKEYDEHCASAGLELAQRWATWDREPHTDAADFAVSVHRRCRSSQVR